MDPAIFVSFVLIVCGLFQRHRYIKMLFLTTRRLLLFLAVLLKFQLLRMQIPTRPHHVSRFIGDESYKIFPDNPMSETRWFPDYLPSGTYPVPYAPSSMQECCCSGLSITFRLLNSTPLQFSLSRAWICFRGQAARLLPSFLSYGIFMIFIDCYTEVLCKPYPFMLESL